MKKMELHILTFSPTGTSRRVAEGIAKGIGGQDMHFTDITRQTSVSQDFNSDQLLLVCVPVYGGHVAPTAMQRLDAIRGNDTPAVPVVVYGNRHYEQALEELSSFLTERGFRTMAAATFIGEHSYSTEQTPIAVGRPDAADILFAEQFGQEIAKKWNEGRIAETIDASAIEQPHQDAGTMMHFKQTVMTWIQSGVPMPASPLADTSLCNACGTCADLCPTSAISRSNPQETDASLCIKCCACVKGCPANARTYPTPFAPLLAENFSLRKENKYLI